MGKLFGISLIEIAGKVKVNLGKGKKGLARLFKPQTDEVFIKFLKLGRFMKQYVEGRVGTGRVLLLFLKLASNKENPNSFVAPI
jgi:hypothetical protein